MARRATSLGSKPTLFVFLFVFFFVWFLSFHCFNRETLFFPLKRAFFGLFSVFLFLPPLTFFGLPLFCFSFSVSLLLLFFFFPFCLFFWCFFCFLFLFFFDCYFSFAFVSSIEQHENTKLQFLLFINMVVFVFLSCFLIDVFLCFFC